MFQFMTSTKICFGEGVLEQSLSIINQYGYSVLLVSGKDPSRFNIVVEYLKAQKMHYQHVGISGEPYIKVVEEIAQRARLFKPDVVVAIGGGSVIDTGKALAALIPNKGNLYDYVEAVGRRVPLKAKPLPFIAIPTTAATGSEVTKNAVLKSGQDKIKVSLRGPEMLPDVALIDPSLTYGMDPYKSSRGAMDAFVHLMEAYVCGEPNPITDMICEEGLKRIRTSIVAACLHDDHAARSDISFAAMLGGMALSNAKLGAAHGLASALGGKLDAPHAVITARLAPHVMQENINAAREQGRKDILKRYMKLAQILTGRKHTHVEDSVLWVNMMLNQLPIPDLGDFGVCKTSFEDVADDALVSFSIKGNPIPLTKERLMLILDQVCSCDGNCHDEVTEQYNEVEYISDPTLVHGASTE
ncbi:iron-containing alcohol dehydrogenase [Vibrio viridaestus]|uniref:Iron-containing alcohol dehydrogenase n=1 Tax=Vibrio viridaestus TaxID=2487322 RepID=A0A3N9TGP5_9VIBR|nr:iron-containing alcohol dehydrogenase [Vibrio viridaestus]RQW63349.1 iron-containing alcohol dehydrogenase [Vibrio viridaestus]